MKLRTQIFCGLVGACLMMSASSAQAAPPLPPVGATTYTLLRAECVETGRGYRSIALIRNQVNYLGASDGNAKSVYYQKVTIQIDKRGGYRGDSWKKVDGRTYSWSRFTRSSQLPTYSTSGIQTGLQPDEAELTAKASVTLKRVRKGILPDKTVWQYQVRSTPFECIDASAFE